MGRAIFHAVTRWVVVAGMIIYTFVPGVGIIALNMTYATSQPILATILDMIWIIAVSVILPINIRWFKTISTVAITIATVGIMYLLYAKANGFFVSVPIYMWAVIVAAIAIGWLLISTPLWRWAQGTMPVINEHEHDQVQPVEHHQS